MKISVLIPTHNRRKTLYKTLETLLSQSYPLSALEVVVLDDCGEDGTFEALSARRAEFMGAGLRDFRVLRNPRNMGVAYNRGLLTRTASESEAFLYIDDDVYMEKDTLAGLVRCLGENPGCALAGPRLVYASAPEKTAHCANFVGRWSGRYTEADPNEATPCDWLNSSCFLVRAPAARLIRHAEEFYINHEEVDLCLQLGTAGWSVMYYPSVRALHDLPVAAVPHRTRLYYLYRNKLLLFKRNFSFARRVTASLVTCCFGVPLYVADSVRYNKGVNWTELRLILKAMLDGLAGRGGKL